MLADSSPMPLSFVETCVLKEGLEMARRSNGVGIWIDPGPSGERLTPLDAPSYLIGRLAVQLSRRHARDYVELDVTHPDVRLIVLLHEKGPLSFRLIVEGSQMDKAQVSRTLPGLIERGLIVVSGPGNGRKRFSISSTADLTPAGRRLFARILLIARRHQLLLLQQMSVQERRMLHAVLHRLIDDNE